MDAILLALAVAATVTDLRSTPSMARLIPAIPEDAVQARCKEAHWDDEVKKRYGEAQQRYHLADLTGSVSEAESAQAAMQRASEADSAMEKAYGDCVHEELEASLPVLPLHALPDASSPKVGEIRMHLVQYGPLIYRFVNPAGIALPFEPDSYDGDWGYTSIYHTVLRRSGDWVQLPRRPFPEPVWLDLRTLGRPPEVIPIEDLYIVHFRTRPFTGSARLVVDASGVHIREETPADMPCGEEFSPEQVRDFEKNARRVTIPFQELSDRDGHLLLSVTYSRGC